MESTLLAGTGKRRITPAPTLLADLRGLGKRRFSGLVLSELYARALAVKSGERTALIISLECDKIPYPERFLERLTQETQVPEAVILLFGTHIHTAPVCGIRPDEPMNSAHTRNGREAEAESAYAAFLIEQTVEAAKEALSSLRAARLGWGEGKSYINVNRVQDYHVTLPDGTEGRVTAPGVNPEGPVDRALFVLRLETLTGEALAFFVNYAVHNVTAIWADSDSKGGLPICSNLGGEISRLLEERFPGSVALWSSGAAGDVNPLWFNEYTFPDETTGMPSSVQATGLEPARLALQVLSRRHYADVLKVLRTITCTEAALSEGAVAWIRTPGRQFICTAEGEGRYETKNAPPYELREQMLLLGDIALCAFSGELYTRLGRIVKNALPEAHVVVINHNLSLLANSGYVFDDETIARLESSVCPVHIPGYGKESHILPGYVGAALAETTVKLYKEIT